MSPVAKFKWPERFGKDQRLYVCRPGAQEWRDALLDYHSVARGATPIDIWTVMGDDWRPGDLLMTYMQTKPMMIVHLDTFTGREKASREIEYEPICHFKHGVPLDLVNDRLGYNLDGLTTYLTAPDVGKVVRALRKECELDTGVFGSERVAQVLKARAASTP